MVAELSIYEQAKALYGEGTVGYVAGILMLELIDSKESHYQGYTPRELEIVTEMRELNRRGLK